jgi:pSer/pThr/pTyr-binding forkhead associated (FHA) protein
MSQAGARPGVITVELGGKSVIAEPGMTLRVGRDPSCDLVASGSEGSREHARITVEDGQWVLIDTSSNGTFVNGRRVDRQVLTDPVELRLGHPTTGDLLRISPRDTAARQPAATRLAEGAATGAATVLGSEAGSSPGQAAAGAPGSLRVQCEGRSYDFAPGKVVTIGRDATSDVAIDSPVVSRVHARVVHGSSGWVLEDAGSSRGVFVNGRRVPRIELRDTTTVTLGPEDEGVRVVFLPARESARRRTGAIVGVVAAVAALAVLIAVIVNAVSGGGGSSLDNLKRATVRLTATVQTQDGPNSWSGSGTIIDKSGLILTNAHVAAPLAPGQGVRTQFPLVLEVSPDYLTVHVTTEPDQPAKPAYRARVVAADGYLDLAVLKIYADNKGEPVTASSLDLHPVKLGDSDQVKAGDAIKIFGFPGIAESDVVDVRNGSIGAPVLDPDKRVEGRFEFNTDGQIAHGNSGGLAADTSQRIIGVPSRFVAPKGYLDPPGDRLIPINLAKPLIDDARSGRKYDPYTYVTSFAAGADASPAGFGLRNEPCGRGSIPAINSRADAARARRGYAKTTPVINADFNVVGMTPQQELLAVVFSARSGEPNLVASKRWTGSAIDCARFEIPTPEGGLQGGLYRVVLFGGPNYENVLAQTGVPIF